VEFSNDKTFILPGGDLYCLAILNSSLAFIWASETLSKLRGGFYEYRRQSMKLFLIRRIHFTTPKKEREKLLEELKQEYLRALEGEYEDGRK